MCLSQRDDPPVIAAYQLIVPALALAPSVTVPVPQFDPGVVPVIVGKGFIVATTDVLVAVVHPPLVASTKYVVVLDITGVVRLVPVPRDDPPVIAAYQLIVPALAVASECYPCLYRTSSPGSSLLSSVLHSLLRLQRSVLLLYIRLPLHQHNMS